MDSVEISKEVVVALNELDINFMIVGSLASNVYGVARNTFDADFVIETDDRLTDIQQRLKDRFKPEQQIGFETMQMTTKPVLHHKPTNFRIELFVLSDDPHDQLRFERRKRIERDDVVTYLPTVEDVIIQKLRWRRKKDVSDVTSVIEEQQDAIDWPYVLKWCDEHGSRDVLDAICSELGLNPAESSP